MLTSPTADQLLVWYDHSRRLLPWRAPPGQLADPYRVWLSEVMLQQTTVAAVQPYFRAFLARWPKVEDLAAAPVEEVMQAWAGLGYYARARNLHLCAKTVAEWRHGRFPDDETALRQLPGIGEYTAAAIAAIAFGRPAVVMDGNVERVMARLHAVTEPLPKAKPRLKALAAALTPSERPGDYAQAVMDLGATICTPKSPACGICPWTGGCAARAQGIEASLPAKLEKPERPTRRGIAFWTTAKDGSVLLRRRPPKGLLGGMMEIPSTDWRPEAWTLSDARAEAPITAEWRLLPGVVRHSFTHFHLELQVAAAKTGSGTAARGVWCPLDSLDGQALPTLMRKVVRHALAKAYERGTL
ncbi:A/G-specific adenine glycosylase [Paramagnetospirillum kuznetsovii]|uniref:Adenine DNA glycosylase n=1 Tax=Paramagnetospirillum kuznetsovii TaxID=2053833 RepID=A0A364P0T3_9PROT|nr:A/G-specific adenine glycosylase [Paramagnetospirillum kuznetsovii]RAU22958.1 A/G-specific adenine glycosylase [Paramagnetospirillum kuznetsovii]